MIDQKNKQISMCSYSQKPTLQIKSIIKQLHIKLSVFNMQEQKEVHNYPLNVDSGSDVYDVEQILDRKPYGSGYMYLIKWQGYPNAQDYTWEPISHLKGIKSMLKEFNAQFDKKVTDKTTKIKKALGKKQPRPSKPISSEVSSSEKSVSVVQKKEISKKVERQNKIIKVKKQQAKKLEKHSLIKPEATEKTPFQKKNTYKEIKTIQRKPINTEDQRFWEKQGCSLGRIHKHFYENGELIFNVNINNDEELICGTAYLTMSDLSIDYEDKIIDYMENWSKNYMINEEDMQSEEYKNFEEYWRKIQ